MDEAAEPDNVKVVLVQEFSELLSILSSQSTDVVEQLCQIFPKASLTGIGHAPSPHTALMEPVKTMLEYFTVASTEECCHFLQTVCMLCENIPMHLETKLMSVTWHGNNVSKSLNVKEEVLPSSNSDCQLIKRPRIDYWEQNIYAVANVLLRRWKQLTENLVCEVSLENVWVTPRGISKAREKPEQTPGPLGKGSKADNEGDLGSVEARMPLETFLNGCTGKVTVLIGPSGSGKSLLMSHLGQQWARKLGPIQPFVLFVLLEFRQLNLISHTLSLSELLFRHFLPPTGSSADKQAIMDYLLSHPDQSCWVLDGYDEFNSKLPTQESSSKMLDPQSRWTVPELISGLLNQQLLPGSTVLITCRGSCRDLEALSDKVGHLMGWNSEDIKEYVSSFFQVKGDRDKQGIGIQAADLLLSTRHLVSMSALPALCNIICISLEHLLLHVKSTELDKMSEGTERKTKNEKDRVEQMQREERKPGNEERVENESPPLVGKSRHLSIQDHIPFTLTQVCLTVLGSFLRHDAKKDKSTVNILGQCGREVRELSQLAWEGVENNKTLFHEKDISPEVLHVVERTRILSKVEVQSDDGRLVNYYCFTQLILQEFLGALRIMTSQHVSDDQLKRRFNLKTRWTTKSDQKTLFDSLQLFVCGLANPDCTPTLAQIARSSSGAEIHFWVKKRQELILQLLKRLSNKNNLTGPKMLELCHCIQECQNHELARHFVSTRPTLELRNIRLLPNDIDALAFVCNSVGDNGVGLDFGACSMELECLDVLQRCQNIQHLCFQGRKYGDKFAEKLSTILPEFTVLKKLEFVSTSLTGVGAATLASTIQNCPHIKEINLSNNNLKDGVIQSIADIVFTNSSTLDIVMLDQNNTSLKAVEYLIQKLSTCSNIKDIHVDGVKTLKVTLTQRSDTNNHKPSISLLNQTWGKSELKRIAVSVAKCPPLSVLDLSGYKWDAETLRILAQSVPRFNVTEKIVLNDSDLSVDNLVILTQLLSDCASLKGLHIRLEPSPAQVTLQFSEEKKEEPAENSKVLSLTCCGLFPADFDKILKSLGASSGISLLDVSGNHLNNKGLKKLLNFLHHLSGIRRIEAGKNSICLEGVVLLAGALCNHNNLSEVQISNEGKDQLTLQFNPHTSCGKEQLKAFRINKSNLELANITAICHRLVKCRSHLELDFSHCSLSDEAVENLCGFLSKMTYLQKLNISHSITSTSAALILVNCLTVNKRVTSIELRPCAESYVDFNDDRTRRFICRMTHFTMNSEHMKRLTHILLQTSHLCDLDLSNNGLTLQGLFGVTRTLCTCKDVCAVDISLKEEKRCLIWFSQDEDCEKSLRIADSSLERDHLLRLTETVFVCSRLAKVEFLNNLLLADWIENFVQQLSSLERPLCVSFDEPWIQSREAVNVLCRCLKLNRRIHTIRVHCTTLQLCLVKASRLTSVSDSSHQLPSTLTESISLLDCAVEGHQLAAMTSIIKECPALTHFQVLTHSCLDQEGAEFLRSVVLTLPRLTSLSIASKMTWLDERLAEALVHARNIQCLNLSGHVITDAAAPFLLEMFPRLRSLTLSHCVWSGSTLLLIKALELCVFLEELCLDTLLDEESMASLAQSLRSLKAMRRLKLSKNTTVLGYTEANSVLPIAAALEGFTNIETLELEGWTMRDGETEQLTKMLPAWTTLRRLSLSNNRISDYSGDQLLRTLKGCVHLEELHVSSNKLGDVTAATMARFLPSLTRITVLDLSENQIGHEGSASLSEAMVGLKNLTRLLLTSVGTSKLCGVAANLAHCPRIQDVGLGWNNCGDEVAVELAKVLPLCQKLTRIDLESNNMSVFGAEALIKALQACPVLQLIRLWKNQVSCSDANRLRLIDKRMNFSPT